MFLKTSSNFRNNNKQKEKEKNTQPIPKNESDILVVEQMRSVVHEVVLGFETTLVDQHSLAAQHDFVPQHYLIHNLKNGHKNKTS